MAEITRQVFKKPIEHRIIEAGSLYWNVDREYFNDRRQISSLIFYRKSILYYLIKKNTSISYKEIVEMFNFRAHQVALKAFKNISFLREKDEFLNRDIIAVEALAEKLDAEIFTFYACLKTIDPNENAVKRLPGKNGKRPGRKAKLQ